MPRPSFNTVRSALVAAIIAGIAVVLIVGSFAVALANSERVLWMGLGTGVTIGVGIALRLGRRNGVLVGTAVGCLTGMVGAAVSATGISGSGILLPPVVGLAIGLIEGIDRHGIRSWNRIIITAALIGFVAGAGSFQLIGISGPIGGLVIGYVVGLYSAVRTARPDRLRFSHVVHAFIVVAIGVIVTIQVEREQETFTVPISIAITCLSLYLAPIGFYILGRWLTDWMRPRLAVYQHVSDYLRVMWIPLGGFAVGYAAIIVIFAGIYGSLYHLDPTHAFEGVVSDPSIGDWLFFSFFNATAQDYVLITPASTWMRLVVGLHIIVSIGWAVVIFAAVSGAATREAREAS